MFEADFAEKGIFFKPAWVSLAVLKMPEIINNVVCKGVLILNQIDPVLTFFPNIKEYFIVVERRGWYGLNEHQQADIKLVEDLSTFADTIIKFPHSVPIDVGPADFVDTDAFKPISTKKRFDVIQVSCWSPRKRIELFIEAAARLPNLTFLHMGHYENNGDKEELEYRDMCLTFAKKIAPNISFPYAHATCNDDFPNTKEEMNFWLNQARLSVLTTTSEGINRFKMESLAADLPCLLPNDISTTTLKHINAKTGLLFSPDVSSLSAAIQEALLKIEEFSPRKYILETTGKRIALKKLKKALKLFCSKSQIHYRFDDIDWDGRNESLLWGNSAFIELNRLNDIFFTEDTNEKKLFF